VAKKAVYAVNDEGAIYLKEEIDGEYIPPHAVNELIVFPEKKGEKS
jgi:hypothetical protein